MKNDDVPNGRDSCEYSSDENASDLADEAAGRGDGPSPLLPSTKKCVISDRSGGTRPSLLAEKGGQNAKDR